MFETVEKNRIKYLSFIDNKNIVAGVTTREHGFSAGCYSSLNMGLNCGDSITKVLQNRNQFLQVFDEKTNLFSLKQTHSNTIIDLENSDSYLKADSLEGDGFITSSKKMMITVTTADCGNIVIHSDDYSVIGVFHAGWRGLENGIISKGVEMIKSKLPDTSVSLSAYIGPMIGKENYEVGEEFYNYFNEKYLQREGEKIYFNTVQKSIDTLKESGVIHIYNSHIDTFDDNRFFSYRRDNKTGRTITFVMLR